MNCFVRQFANFFCYNPISGAQIMAFGDKLFAISDMSGSLDGDTRLARGAYPAELFASGSMELEDLSTKSFLRNRANW